MKRVKAININDIKTSYTYNDDNQLLSAGDIGYIYNRDGSLHKTSNGTVYSYNEYGETSEIAYSNSNINSISYTYDNIGRIKTIGDKIYSPQSLEKTEYFYDMQSRIESVKVNEIETERYTYDDNGNRLTAKLNSSQSEITATYDAQDKMLTYGENSYTYTPNGSLLTKSNSEGTTKYTYDAMGNLIRVILPNNRGIIYEIDARGRRINKTVNHVFKYGFIYKDQLNPIAKVDENGTILETYVYGLKSNIPEYVIKGQQKYKIISNHLGSPVIVLDSNNNIVKKIKYDTFGNIIEEDGDFELPFRFAGGLYDEDTKLVRFGARDYDTETGRWTSQELTKLINLKC